MRFGILGPLEAVDDRGQKLGLGGHKQRVHAETLTGEARANAWERLVSNWQGYAGYQEKTDRVIPVIRLKAI